MSVLISVPGPNGQLGTQIRIHPMFNLRLMFPALVNRALVLMRDPAYWSESGWFGDFAQRNGLTVEDLVQAHEALSRYMESCLDVEQESPLDAVRRCGFLDCSPDAQAAVYMHLGQLLVATLWWPLKEGTHLTETLPDANLMRRNAEEMRQVLTREGLLRGREEASQEPPQDQARTTR